MSQQNETSLTTFKLYSPNFSRGNKLLLGKLFYIRNHIRIMSLDSIGISTIMNKNIIVVEQDLNLISISKIMSNNDIGSVVIVDDLDTRRPIGIITERDIVRTIGMIQPHQLLVSIREHIMTAVHW